MPPPSPLTQPLLVGFQASGVYDPYIVLSGAAASTPPSPELQAGIEATLAGGPGGGVGETLAGPELSFCGVLSIGQHDNRDGGGGAGDDGEEMDERER